MVNDKFMVLINKSAKMLVILPNGFGFPEAVGLFNTSDEFSE